MTELLRPNGDILELHRSHQDDNEHLPTPLLTPLIGSPLLKSFAKPIYESVDEQLDTPGDRDHASKPSSLATPATQTNGHKGSTEAANTSDGSKRTRAASDRLSTPGAISIGSDRLDKVLKLSPQELKELTLDAGFLPIARIATPVLDEHDTPFSAPPYPKTMSDEANKSKATWERWAAEEAGRGRPTANRTRRHGSFMTVKAKEDARVSDENQNRASDASLARPIMPARTASTPPNIRRKSLARGQSSRDVASQKKFEKPILSPLHIKEEKENTPHNSMNGHAKVSATTPSSLPTSMLPIPPLSIPTFLQLELDAQEPSQLYIHRELGSEIPYESSAVKFERLENFLLLPGHLEGTLLFGAAACFDAWLYNLTILPLRFLRALTILGEWWTRNAWKELCDLVDFVYRGIGRLWRRKREGSAPPGSETPNSQPRSRRPSNASEFSVLPPPQQPMKREPHPILHAWPAPLHRPAKASRRHRRTRSTPSLLLPSHKADLLKGLLILASSFVLMYLDPSRMYHSIRGQAAIKLYVIYNMLEVADKLLGSIGQDILECLFSSETLSRNEMGRSKILRPTGLFLLGLAYVVVHASALFYQVITLNVAVNSYSNALLTLLMSNQFVEIKGAVFKKFEKENLFQMCCADVVERFQLLLMLLVIAMRNIVEVGGLSITFSSSSGPSTTNEVPPNGTGMPFSSSSILPKSFSMLPNLGTSGKVLTPFLIVIASEMIVDWLKYAYINKFNNFHPRIFGRFHDVLAKDYYTHAFGDQNLTRRIGLPVFPLTVLFIRASMQTWQMVVAELKPTTVLSSVTSLALEEELPTSTPATTAALAHIDKLFRRALGTTGSDWMSFSWLKNFDDLTAILTTTILLLVVYLLLLAFKLLWGMFLLSISRRRYMSMQERQQETEQNKSVDTEGKRIGGWGQVEVGEERRKLVYEGDEDGLRRLRDKERKGREKKDLGKEVDYGRVRRWDMVAKRIW